MNASSIHTLSSKGIVVSPTSHHKAVFLDRDGTINKECNYLFQKEKWEWLPGVVEGLAALRKAGFMLIVVTNQAGIARGYYTTEQMNELHHWANAQLKLTGSEIDAFYHCPHHPDFTPGGCQCRKPSAFLLQEATQKYAINLDVSWMVGDKLIDIKAGLAAGCTPVLVRTGYGRNEEATVPQGTFVAENFTEAVFHILQHDLGSV